jgi:hypothetical protein
MLAPAELSETFVSDFTTVDLNLEEASSSQEVADEHRVDASELTPALADGVEYAFNPEVNDASDSFEETTRAELPVEDDLPEQVSFLSKDTTTAVRNRPARRWLFSGLSLVLLVGLLLQVTYRERNRLAAWDPSWAPWLERACGVISCKVAAVRRIESISVESSTFAKLSGDAYRLSFVLKSNASIPIDFPAVELTLTDAMDQPFLRRVLLASDIGPPSSVLAASAEWPASIDIAVQSTGLPERVAGYRLVAFYP